MTCLNTQAVIIVSLHVMPLSVTEISSPTDSAVLQQDLEALQHWEKRCHVILSYCTSYILN